MRLFVQAPLNTLVQGALVLDTSAATLRFESGQAHGDAEVRFSQLSALSYPSAPQSIPMWAAQLLPGRINVEGDVKVDIGLPKYKDEYTYLDVFGEYNGVVYGILLGLDDRELTVKPAGLVSIDVATHRAVSIGETHFDRLDVIGLAVPIPIESLYRAFEDYAQGRMTWPQLQVALEKKQ